MNVYVFDEQQDLQISIDQVKLLVQEVLKNEQINCDEVAIHFVDEKKICELHAEYFNDPSPTDCISFPMDSPQTPGYTFLGEVFVCPHIAINYAKAHHTDPYQETALYVIHGLLHLIGYDDMDDVSEKEMRLAETTHLKNSVAGKKLKFEQS